MEHAVPAIIKDHYFDMHHSDTSKWARANAARRYSEAMIDMFLSDEIKNQIGEDKYYKMRLSEVLQKLEKGITPDLQRTLEFIKDIGDKGSHAGRKKSAPNEQEVNKAVSLASYELLPLIIHNYFANQVSFFSIDGGPKLFSALLPSIRVYVLEKLIDFRSKKLLVESNLDKNLLHKYVLATYKNGQREKIRRRLRELKNKSRISEDLYIAFCKTIENLDNNISKLPIPKTMQDSKRNFDNVLDQMDEEGKKNNKRLIEMINKLLSDYTPSKMGNLEGDYIMHNEYINFRKL